MEWQHPGFHRTFHRRASGSSISPARPIPGTAMTTCRGEFSRRCISPGGFRGRSRFCPACVLAWRAGISSARDRIRRRPAALLDGGRSSPALFPRSTAGLLFHEHVGRVRHFRRHGLGAHAALDPRRRSLRLLAARPRGRVHRLAAAASCCENANGQWGPTAARSTAWRTIMDIPISTWLGFRVDVRRGRARADSLFRRWPLVSSGRNRPRLALTALAAAMVPIGFSMMDGVARMAPYFSLADAAEFIHERDRA